MERVKFKYQVFKIIYLQPTLYINYSHERNHLVVMKKCVQSVMQLLIFLIESLSITLKWAHDISLPFIYYAVVFKRVIKSVL